MPEARTDEQSVAPCCSRARSAKGCCRKHRYVASTAGSGGGNPICGSGFGGIDGLLKFPLVLQPDEGVHDFTTLEQDERGDTADAIGGR